MNETCFDILALALGRTIMRYTEGVEWGLLIKQLHSDAIDTLEKIKSILDDEELDDFACVEEIVNCLDKIGVQTRRHDFG